MVRYAFVLFVALGIFTTSSLAGTLKNSKNSMDSSCCSGPSCNSQYCAPIKELYQYLFGPCSIENKIAVANELKSRVVDPKGRDAKEADNLNWYIEAMMKYQTAKSSNKDKDYLKFLEKQMKDAEVDLRNWYQKTLSRGTRTALALGALACVHFGGKAIKKAQWSPKWAKKPFFWIKDEPETKLSGNASNSTKLSRAPAPATEPPFFSASKILWSIIIICVVLLGVAVYMFRDQLGFGGDEEEEDSKSKSKKGSKEKSGQEGGKVSSPDEKITTTTPSSKVLTPLGSLIAAIPIGSKIKPATGSKIAPAAGSKVAPATGSKITPAAGSKVAPAAGSKVAPATGSKIAATPVNSQLTQAKRTPSNKPKSNFN